MDEEKTTEAIIKEFKDNYEINMDYSTMTLYIKEKQKVVGSSPTGSTLNTIYYENSN